jgi:hypothetical protein
MKIQNHPAAVCLSTIAVLVLVLSLGLNNRAYAVAAATDATATTDEDTSVTITPTITGIIIDAVTSESGTVSFTDTTITYTPAPDFNGTEYIGFDVRDSSDGTIATASATITVTSVNDAPVTVDDSGTILEDAAQTSFYVASNDSDDDTVTSSLVISAATISSGDTSGTVSYSDGNVLYTPSSNYNGTTVISYTVADTYSTPATGTGTLTVTVTAVNDAPVTTSTVSSPQTESIVEDTATDIDMSTYITDTADSDSISITSVTYTGNGVVSITGDDLIISYTPDTNFTGDENMYYSAADTNGGTVSGMLTVSVSSVTEAPVAVADSATVNEDSTANLIDVKLNDTDDDDAYADLVISSPAITTTTALGTVTTAGSVSISGQKLSYTPAANFYGTEVITYTLTDTDGLTDTAGTLTVTVNNTNDGPTAVNDTASTAANTAVTIAVLDNDTDLEADTLSINSVSPSSNGTTTISGTSIIYTPNTDFSGTDTFTYEATDTTGQTSIGTVNVTVTVANVGSCSTSASTITAVANGCSVTPSAFRTSVYAFGLCTASPTRPTSSAAYDLSNCQLMYDGTSGAGTTVTFGATNTSYTFSSFTAPSNGSYTHGILIIGNAFDAKGILELSGTNCVTIATLPYIQCNSSYTINDADYIPSSSIDYFYTSGTYSYTFSSDSVTADIIDTNNQLISTDGTGSRILAIQEFSSAQTISDTTRTIDIGFRISQGLTIDSTSSSASAAPFSIRFQVQ